MRETPEGMRPIGARLLKSAIDTLRPEIEGAKVLELFAGQGRFGFECLKEHAASTTFIEKSSQMVSELKLQSTSNRYKNAETKVIQCDAFKYLEAINTKYDIVFADPPFSDWTAPWQEKFFARIIKALNFNSILLVKCPSQMIVFPTTEGLTSLKETVIGESKLLYYKYDKKQPTKD